MNVISIFIAGAKNLKEQRLRLKAMTNDLNASYSRLKWKVSLQSNSYENFGDRQDDYNDFITNQADLVIFVLEGHIGKKTEEEYLLATNAYKQNGHPEIITFVHAFDERTPEIAYIEQVVNSASDMYYVDYTNTEDLLSKAKDRINTFVEKRVKQKKQSKSKAVWRKGLLCCALGLFLASLLFVASVLFSPKKYLIVTTNDLPVSLVKAGLGKEFVKQQIADGVRETGDSVQVRFEAILNELWDSSDDSAQRNDTVDSPILLNANLKNVVSANVGNTWLWDLRRLLGKHDVRVSVRLVESEQTYVSRITLDAWDGLHDVKTIEAKKMDFSDNLRCALSIIKKSAAYITMAYSPVASALYDYQPSEGLEVYQMNNPWQEDLYTHSRREAMLLENSVSSREDAAYGLLLVANFYEKGNAEHHSPSMIRKACAYYEKFLKQRKEYQTEIKYKIQKLEEDLVQDNREEETIPEILIQNGKIPVESFCNQLIVITDEEKLYAKGTTYYKAYLHTFEKKNENWAKVFPAYKVNLGVKGMASVDQKMEGDLKTPSGFYPIPFVFGYKKDIETKMDFVVVSKNHVWVCDTASVDYNKLVIDKEGKYKNNLKNEKLFRPDILNKYAIAIGYNMSPIVKGKGSAIFMHVERSTNHKTAGCISMPENNIKDLIKWLDPQRKPYVFICKQLD